MVWSWDHSQPAAVQKILKVKPNYGGEDCGRPHATKPPKSHTMKIGGFQKFSLIDYPNKISCVLFTLGCNFRCGYCHNPELLEMRSDSMELFSVKEIMDFLESRVGKLEGVVITGGEPTIQKGLLDFISEIKEMGFLVKLDTNGSSPVVLRKALNLVDYVAMDIKGPLSKYEEISGYKHARDNNDLKKSIELILGSGVDHEFRTTVVKGQLDKKDFLEIGKMVAGAQRYILQKFLPTKTLDKSFLKRKSFSDEEFDEVIGVLQDFVGECFVR